MEKIFVIGAGTMGRGIVEAFAKKDYEVYVYDENAKMLDSVKTIIEKNLNKLVEKGKILSQEKDNVIKNIYISNSLSDCKNAVLVIDAVFEDVELKKKIFKEVEKYISDFTILATNTSSLSITEIANSLENKDRFLGMHFFNPANIMKLVEIIGGEHTDKKYIEKTIELSEKIDKIPVVVNEAPGFIVNRILIPMINEAINILAENVASKEDIDNAMKYGANHPIGPLALADLIGNDVVLAIMEVLYKETGDAKYRPSLLLKKMVRANKLGKKTQEGFYTYGGHNA